MTHDNCLKSFYDERATMAHLIEHLPLGNTPSTREHYAALQADIHSLEALFAQAWRVPSVNAAHTLPWCSICGRGDRALVPGRMLCSVCEDIISTGEITQGEQATAPHNQEDTVGLPYCRMCKRNDRAIWSLEHMLCSVCVGNLEKGAITPGEHAEAPHSPLS